MIHICTQSLLNWGQTVKLMSSSPNSEDHCLHLKKKKTTQCNLHATSLFFTVCTSVKSDIYIWSCDYCPDQDTEQLSLKVFPCPLIVSSSLDPQWSRGLMICFLFLEPSHFLEAIMESSGIGVWLLSLSIMQMRSSSLLRIWVVPSYCQVACKDAWMDRRAYPFNSQAAFGIWAVSNLGQLWIKLL